MKRVVILFFLLVFNWHFGASAAVNSLKIKDIHHVMGRFFSYHIENKDWNPTLIRRMMKLYIEQFDPEKAYLLESEILSYFYLSDAQAEAILHRLQEKNYSDFAALNGLFQRSVERFRKNRELFAIQMSEEGVEAPMVYVSHSHFARSVSELSKRQQTHMIRFFSYHEARTHLETPERRAKVFALFDKKLKRAENQTLYIEGERPMNGDQIEHLFSLRILKSFAKSLDTHTSFFSPEEAHEMRFNLEKQFEGVGIILSEGVDGIMIAEMIEGGPAHESGQIAVNDFLIEIDGQLTHSLQLQEVLELLKKKDRGQISLGLKRVDKKTGEPHFFRVQLSKQPIVLREERIQTSYVPVNGGIIGKITLHSFYESGDRESSEKDIKAAIRFFREKGELLGLVLDLRDNSGGFLSQAVKVAGLFISNGIVVISKYGKGEIHYLRNLTGKSFYSGPLLILTSKMSASAAEIVAQSLQDYGVGLVVGDNRTFGKGSIQYQTITDDKADYYFKVTVGRYYTPSGRSTQIEGVIPDIVLPGKYSPYRIGERYLEFSLPPDQETSVLVDPLHDLDESTRQIFEKRYMPYLQRVMPYWKQMLPTLRQNSQERLEFNVAYRNFLEAQENRQHAFNQLPVNTIDENIQTSIDAVQMDEAVEILKDMIEIDARQQKEEAALAS